MKLETYKKDKSPLKAKRGSEIKRERERDTRVRCYQIY